MPVNIHPLTPEELMAYLDGELVGVDASTVEAHLKSCSECQGSAAEFEGIGKALREWTPAIEEGVFEERWRAAALAATHTKRGVLSWRSWLGWVLEYKWLVSAGVAAAALLVVFVLPRTQTKELALAREQRATELMLLGGTPPNRGFRKMLSAAPSAIQSVTTDPKIARKASLVIITNDYSHLRTRLDQTLGAAGGFAAQLDENSGPGEGPTLTASLRVPAARLDATLARLKELGRVESESQRGEEVTDKVVNVEARLNNLRAAEVRLTEILRQRTGRLSDVLAVEEHLTSVRGQIETAEAEQKLLATQIALSRIDLRVNEEVRRSLNPANGKNAESSIGLRLWNALVEGLQNLRDTIITITTWLLSSGPTLLLIAAILFFPLRSAIRRQRH